MAKQLPNVTHLLYLDGLRALAAIYVVAHHAIVQFYDGDTQDLTGFRKLLIKLFFSGHLAVDVFIVLSGFCLMIPVIKSGYQLKGGAYLFYKRRVIRIIPTYYITIGFCLLLINFFIGEKTGTKWDIALPVSKEAVLADMLFIQDCFSNTVSKVNYVFWSVAVETRIYVLFPLLVFLYKRLNALWLILISVVASLIIFYLLQFLNLSNNIVPLHIAGLSPYLILFILGMIGADICFAKATKFGILKRVGWGKIFLVTTLLVIVVNKLLTKGIATWQELDVAIGLWTVCLLIIGNQEILQPAKFSFVTKILCWKPLVFIGTFAYSIYLTHAPILQMITKYVIFPMHLNLFNSSIFALTISLPLCICFAYIFFLFFEKPFLTMGKKVSLKSLEVKAGIDPAI